MLSDCLLRLPTPSKFLVAIGDWQLTANVMLALALLMMIAAAEGKRPQDELQDAGGVQTSTGELAAVKTYYRTWMGAPGAVGACPSLRREKWS